MGEANKRGTYDVRKFDAAARHKRNEMRDQAEKQITRAQISEQQKNVLISLSTIQDAIRKHFG